jgi:hypothetical protein
LAETQFPCLSEKTSDDAGCVAEGKYKDMAAQ